MAKNISDKRQYINKPFYTSEDISHILDISPAYARLLMRSKSFPLIEIGQPDSWRAILRVEAVAFWKWISSEQRNHTKYRWTESENE